MTATNADRELALSDAGEPDRPATSTRRFGRLGRLRRLRRFGRIPRLESPFAASILSCLLPGLGQLAMGRGRWALLFLVPSLLGLGWIAVQLSQGLAWFGLSLLDETFVASSSLKTVMPGEKIELQLGADEGVAIKRKLVNRFSEDTGLTGKGRRRWPRLERAIVATLVIAITATHVVAIAGAWSVYRTGVAINSNNMLSDSSLAGGSPSATSTAPTPSPTPTPTPTPTPEAYSSLPPWAFDLPSATPAPTYPSNPDRITFLLIGVDLMTGRSHALTDSMILATLDVHTNKATIISVPRDTAYFDLYYGGSVSGGVKLNELMSAASSASFGSP